MYMSERMEDIKVQDPLNQHNWSTYELIETKAACPGTAESTPDGVLDLKGKMDTYSLVSFLGVFSFYLFVLSLI